MKNVLWLPAWYPNKTAPFDGDFIQRHAVAVSLYCRVHVIYVVKDENNKNSNGISIEQTTSGNLKETIAYVRPFKTGIKPLDKIISILKYIRVNKQLASQLIKQEGKPDLAHVHVALWAGLIALWLKKNYNIRYLLTEHWTGYERTAKDNVYKRDFFFRRSTKKVIQNASLLLPVADRLGKIITGNFAAIPYKVIPNVVDTRYFNLADKTSQAFRFIHVSGMSYQKNCEGMLRSFSKLLLHKKNIELVMAGPASSELRLLAHKLGADRNINWMGEIAYTEVAAALQQASCLVMFSRYENLPCAILEALCCGLPVIASRTGDIEMVINNSNGILVNSENEEALLDAMNSMIEKNSDYNKLLISNNAMARFNYEKIGKEIKEAYENLL